MKNIFAHSDQPGALWAGWSLGCGSAVTAQEEEKEEKKEAGEEEEEECRCSQSVSKQSDSVRTGTNGRSVSDR